MEGASSDSLSLAEGKKGCVRLPYMWVPMCGGTRVTDASFPPIAEMSTRAVCCALQSAVLPGKGSCWSQQPAKPFGFECQQNVKKRCSYFWFWWFGFFFVCFFSLSLLFSILQLLLNLEVMTGAALSCSGLRINLEHKQGVCISPSSAG